jgi:hypothetical protein
VEYCPFKIGIKENVKGVILNCSPIVPCGAKAYRNVFGTA